MVVWCLMLFGLGAAAFLDTQYNYGLIFRQVNAVLFMSMSLAILYRITTKVRAGEREALEAKLAAAQNEIESLQTQLKHGGVTGSAPVTADTPHEELKTV